MPKKAPAEVPADPWAGATGPVGGGVPDDDPPWGNSGDGDSGALPHSGATEAEARVDAESDPDAPIRAAARAREQDHDDQTSGLDEFHKDTTTNPAPPPKKPRATSGRRKPAAKTEPSGTAAEKALLEPTEQQMQERESIDDIQFSDLDDSDDYLRILLYGPDGTRKTTNACLMTRLSRPGRVLVVNAEGGLKKQALRKHGVDTSRIAVWPNIQRGEQVTFAGLERLFYRLSSDLTDDPFSWLGVIWDSATDIHQGMLDQVVAADIAKQTAILEKNVGRRPGNIVLRDAFERDGDDYTRMSNQFRMLLRKYRYLPCHLVVTALLRVDGEGRKAVAGPAVTPAIGKDLRGYMDMVLSLQVAQLPGGFVGFAETVPTLNRRAKDRFDVLPAELPNPTFDRLLSYVTGELTVDNDPDMVLMPEPDAPTDAAAKAVVATVQQKSNPVREATVATARRVASGKKAPVAAAPVSSVGDEPPY